METLYIYTFGLLAALIIIVAPIAYIAARRVYVEMLNEVLGHPASVAFYLGVTMSCFMVTPLPYSLVFSTIFLAWMVHGLLVLSKYKRGVTDR